MGKPSGKKKKHAHTKSSDSLQKSKKPSHNTKIFDRDTTAFIDLSHELKEGNKQFHSANAGKIALHVVEKLIVYGAVPITLSEIISSCTLEPSMLRLQNHGMKIVAWHFLVPHKTRLTNLMLLLWLILVVDY